LLDRVYRTAQPEELAEQQHGLTPPAYWSYAVWPILGTDDRPVGVMIQVTDSTEVANYRRQTVAMNEALLVSGIRQEELAENLSILNAQLLVQNGELRHAEDAGSRHGMRGREGG
jgi:hypothetical protein